MHDSQRVDLFPLGKLTFMQHGVLELDGFQSDLKDVQLRFHLGSKLIRDKPLADEHQTLALNVNTDQPWHQKGQSRLDAGHSEENLSSPPTLNRRTQV